MKRKIATLAIVVLAAVWAGACFPTIRQPEVQLVGVRLGSLGLQGGQLLVQVSVNNPNSFALRASGFTYNIQLREPEARSDSWAELADGVFSRDVQVAAHDSTIVEIPVEFRYAWIGTVVRSLLNTGTFGYRISGSVAVEKPIRKKLPYQHTGTANLINFD